MLVEADPARVGGDLDEARPEAGAADVDLSLCDLAGRDSHLLLIGAVRVRP